MKKNRKFSSEWIQKFESREHWLSYWHQIKIMESSVNANDSLIEIGIGTGFTSNYLKSKKIKVLTVDVDKNKSPDIVADAVSFIPSKKYDHFCAFEVFEHMKFSEMVKTIENLKKHISNNFFISIPIYKKTPIAIELKIKSYWKSMTIPLPKTKIIDPHHEWELNYKNFTEKRLISEFEKRNFKLEKRLSYLRWRYFHFSKNN